jgi:hypothetical protein
MEAKVREHWTKLVGAKVMNTRLGECIITGLNCDNLYGHRIGEESIHTMPVMDVTVISYSRKTNIENEFLKVLEEETNTSFQEVVEKQRCREEIYKEFRFFHMIFRNKIMNLTLSQAGAIYGKDHATVLYANKQICLWVKSDRRFREKYETVIRHLTNLRPNVFKQK